MRARSARTQKDTPKTRSRQFDRVIAILDAIDAAGDTPPLMADLRVLATGFRQLASAAALPLSAAPCSRGPDAATRDGRT